jgi:hypothetical protein
MSQGSFLYPAMKNYHYPELLQSGVGILPTTPSLPSQAAADPPLLNLGGEFSCFHSENRNPENYYGYSFSA